MIATVDGRLMITVCPFGSREKVNMDMTMDTLMATTTAVAAATRDVPECSRRYLYTYILFHTLSIIARCQQNALRARNNE